MRARQIGAELGGTALLLYVIVGSGIVVERIGNDSAGGLFYHAAVVGLVLMVLIAWLAPVSGAHFNPAVTLAFWRRRALDTETAIGYIIGQIAGAIGGVGLAVVSFGYDSMSLSSTTRTGWGLVIAELVGTLVLVLLILGVTDQDRASLVPAVVGGWVTVMIFASPSAGFINPAVTVARMFTDSYTGIAPTSVPGFLLAQLTGVFLAVLLSPRPMLIPELKGT